MKKSFLIPILCFAWLIPVAQNDVPAADSTAISNAALDYGDGFYSGDAARMEKAISPDLNKAIAIQLPQTGKTILSYSTYTGLIELTRAKSGLLEEDKRKTVVTLLGINGDIACAKLTSSRFNDYLQLVKIDNAWKIINVLWTFGTDAPNRPKTDFNPENEKTALTLAAMDYIEGVYIGNVERVEKAIHPEICRVTPVTMAQTGKTYINKDKGSYLIEITRAKLINLEKEKLNISVKILDIMDGLATMEINSAVGWSYVHLAKIDGQWKVINVLSRKNPSQPKPGK